MVAFSKQTVITTRGFSLVELLVTMSIIVILTVIAVARYGAYDSATLLRNQAFEIALDIRQAQQYAVSIQASDTGGSVDYREEYGMLFRDVDPTTGTGASEANRQKYLLWQDVGARGFYAPIYTADPDIEVAEFALDDRFEISAICETPATPSAPCESQRDAHISFQRPNFDADIRLYESGNPSPWTNDVESVSIFIASKANPAFQREIIINSAGLITVE